MLGFLRFNQINYNLEAQSDCISEQLDSCYSDRVYKMPFKPGDTVNWIMDISAVAYQGAQVPDLKIGLVSCGVLVVADIGTIEQGTSVNQLYCSATIHSDLGDCDNVQLVVYSIYDPVDCSTLMNATGADLCSAGYFGGQLQCSGTDLGC